MLWRGGTPVGVVVHEFLLYKGVETYHAAVKVESYEGIGKRTKPRVEHLDAVVACIPRNAQVLIVDDIYDTGATIRRIRGSLQAKTSNVKVATLYCKTGVRKPDDVPDYFLRETGKWVVFPHELVGLTPAEIRRKDKHVHGLLS